MFKTDIKDLDVNSINKMIKVSSKLKKVSVNEFSGWSEFVKLLDGYCNSLLENKKNFNLAMASKEQIDMLKLYDRDVWLINNFIKKIPTNFVDGLESALKDKEEEEEFNNMMEK